MSIAVFTVALGVYCIGALAIVIFAVWVILIFAIEVCDKLNKLWSTFLHFHQFRRLYGVLIRLRKKMRELTEEEADELERTLTELFSRSSPHA